jgi:hypothetical protein
MDLTPETIAALRTQLQTSTLLAEVSLADVKNANLVPKSLSFGPDLCLAGKKQCHLIYALGTGELPQWVIGASGNLKRFKNTHVTILAVHTPSIVAYKNASKVAEQCINLESVDGCFLVFPPFYRIPTACSPKKEIGHVPSWIRAGLLEANNLSDHLRKAVFKLNKEYEKAAKQNYISYEDECQLLMGFAHALRKGDTRLFCPVDLLAVLKEFEHAGGNPGARDHFFHTFNNLFLGLLILNTLASARKHNVIPDRFIAPPRGQPQPALKLWESLWALTCLFHDPGYMGENFWQTFAVALGADAKVEEDAATPDPVITRINNAWDSEFLEARNDLIELFKHVAGLWQLSGSGVGNPAHLFDPALRRAYFNGRKCGHSLVSGLNLIKRCRKTVAVPASNYDKEKASKACVIAALSMMFHDSHSRHTLVENGVPPISFEDLPYAATLMFADALQDDRRDIKASRFPKEGVLDSLSVRQDRVLATICLPRIPVKWWPGKIIEYQSVMRWINSASETKFNIDYRSKANWHQPPLRKI